MSPAPVPTTHARLISLHKAALGSRSFEELAIRIVGFRAYGLALSDAGVQVNADHIKVMDDALVQAFTDWSGNAAALRDFLP